MTIYKGKGVYGGVAAGKISVFRRQAAEVKCENVDDTERELERLDKAKASAIAQLNEIYEKTLNDIGEEAAIFEIHMMMIEDEDYNNAIAEMVTSQNINAEYAVNKTGDSFAEMSAENAHKNGKWIGICGELAADTTLTEAFLRMGIDELSVSPSFVLKVRETVRSIDLTEDMQAQTD